MKPYPERVRRRYDDDDAANPFRVANKITTLSVPRVSKQTPGLELANTFGVMVGSLLATAIYTLGCGSAALRNLWIARLRK